MIELTLDKTKELLTEAVAEKGAEYVYTNPEGVPGGSDSLANCYYVHGSQPGCIVGHVLHKAGVPLETLTEHETRPAGFVLRSLEDFDLDHNTLRLLDDVQERQDRGVPWGEAVQQALAELER